MLRTIFFLPPARRLFTFSRSALLSSPNTIRPSSATTETPSTSRFVNFSATLHPPQNQTPRRPAAQKASRGQISVKIRARHIIPAQRANQLAAPSLQRLRAVRAITRSGFRGELRFPKTARGPVRRVLPFRQPGEFHGPKVIAHPEDGGKHAVQMSTGGDSGAWHGPLGGVKLGATGQGVCASV